MKCNICGAELNGGERVCKYCGNELPEVEQIPVKSETTEYKEIPAVDEKVPENAERQVFIPESERRYCPKCGGPLDGKTNKCAVCEVAEVGKAGYRKNVTEEDAEEYVMASSRKRKRKNNGGRIALFVMLFVVMVVLFFVSVYFGVELLGGISQEEEVTPSPQPTIEVIATAEPQPVKTPEVIEPEPTKKPSVVEPPADKPEEVIKYYGGEYLFPSYEKIITESELSKLDRQEIKLILQEIYARYGYTFEDDDLVEHFESQSWYVPTTTNIKEIESKLNKYEKENIEIIEKYQRKKGWRI